MGKISNSINHYLSDNRRFADLFNGIFFQGEAVIHAEDLLETSQIYHGTIGEAGKTGSRKERIRDVCKLLKSGETLRVLAVENQEMIDYGMPFRCMQYDVMEYGKQLDALRKKNRQENQLKTIAERICGIKRTDRIVPVYTLCLYHGTEPWDGPRSLGDMMNFECRKDIFRKIFKDYPLQLYCLNEARNLQVFHTEVGVLFQALQYRKDREGLKRLAESDSRYQQLDADTLETLSVMLEWSSVWRQKERYIVKNMKNEEEYNMCQALREWAEEERSIGRMEGHKEGRREGADERTHTIVKNMLMRGMEDADIMAIAECDQIFLDKVRMTL
ncbi:MAG: hypothetical protein J1E64_04530 [Acetatifactor sp.]|nr:hypothetical protein [Acetatifactor sp.]